MSLNLARKNISSYQTQKRVMFLQGLYVVSQGGFKETKRPPSLCTTCPPNAHYHGAT